MAKRKRKKQLEVEALKHDEAKRKNIPTQELESVMSEEDKHPVRIAYERRNRDLDPQLIWRGKDEQDWSDLVVPAPPLYIQEKVHPKVLIDDLRRETKERAKEEAPETPDLFADFNGLPDQEAKTEFYQHDANWSNRFILGDSLQVMASLAEREGLRGQVQCIYVDPPYGIKFNSNFQWSTTSREVKDGKKDHITREPEQVRAFRDTWRDGIHSYLAYLRDRLTVCRDLLTDTGSIFVQIGDENVHLLRSLLDEVFGVTNFVSLIVFQKTGSSSAELLSNPCDYLVWYAKNRDTVKYRQLYFQKKIGGVGAKKYTSIELGHGIRKPLSQVTAEELESGRVYRLAATTSQGFRKNTSVPFEFRGRSYDTGATRNWKTTLDGMRRLVDANRIEPSSDTLNYVRFIDDFPAIELTSVWPDIGGIQSRADPKVYVVQTATRAIERCILMTTDPGDLVFDPTCGSGTTAYVAEQWGRRWITIDTSRVSLALARSRVMGARYPYYYLADSPEGQQKEAEVTGKLPSSASTQGDVRQGFIYEQVPHITLKSIANNAEIDIIWEEYQETLEPQRKELIEALGESREEWQIPREAAAKWPAKAKKLHAAWWEARIERQKKIDESIVRNADTEFLYDKPYIDNSRIRVAGPFTVESLSPHRILAVDQDDVLIDTVAATEGKRGALRHGADAMDFAQMVLENLGIAGVQQAHKEDRIIFTSLTGWPGNFICAEGRYQEGNKEKRAGIFIGPEFGTVARPDLAAAAREAGEAGFDVLIACAFNFDAHSAEFDKLGRIPVLKARMNPDLHMAGDLKATRGGNLFVVFGEPDIDVEDAEGGKVQVKIKGVDVFHPQSGEIDSGGPDSIAMWFIDTDYNEESFFVRQAYFLGASSDPYKALKTTLKNEIDKEAWETLYSDTSRPFDKPKSGRIAVKVINHLGDEVMKIYSV